MFCPSCGNKLTNPSYCQHCGACFDVKSNKRHSDKGLIAAFIIVIALAVIVGGIFIAYIIGGSSLFSSTENYDFDDYVYDEYVSIETIQRENIVETDPFFVIGYPESEVILTGFAANEMYVVLETETLVTFTVQTDAVISGIELWGDDCWIGLMTDDGTNGDAVANDGVYSLETEIVKYTDSLCSSYYYCSYEDAVSESVEIYFFPVPNEESVAEARIAYEELGSAIYDVESSYADASGFVPVEYHDEVILQVESILEQAKNDGTVLHYEIEDNSVYAKMSIR